MAYVDSQLGPGEQVLFRTRLHPVVLAGTVGFSAFVVGCAALIIARNELAPATVRWLCLAAAAIVLASALPPVLRWWRSEFAVTNRRLLARVGLYRVHCVEVPAPTGDAIGVEQTLPGRLLDYGTVRLGRSGSGSEVFVRVARAQALREAVVQQGRSASASRAR
jgi:hypothetical protein